jgi:hypothetical protein
MLQADSKPNQNQIIGYIPMISQLFPHGFSWFQMLPEVIFRQGAA